MKTLSTILARMVQNHIALLMIILFCSFATTTFAQQQPVLASNNAPLAKSADTTPKLAPGLSADKKTYVAKNGMVLTVGGKFTVGKASDTQNNLLNSYHSVIPGLKLVNEKSYLSGKFSGSSYEIKEFDTDRDGSITYLYFKKGLVKYQVAIESAIMNGELVP